MKRSKEGKVLKNNAKCSEVNVKKCGEKSEGHGLPVSLPVSVPNMASYIICFSSREGVPLFISKHPSSKSLPFPVLGSLNIIHTFTKSQQIITLNSLTKTDRIVWKEFDSVILIAIASRRGSSHKQLRQLLDTVYQVMTLFLGEQDVVEAKNVEKLKRDLRCCTGLVDLLRSHHFEINIKTPLIGDLTQGADCIFCSESSYLKNILECFAQFAHTPYACLFVNCRVVTATRDWLALDGPVKAVITFYLLSLSNFTCKDVPLFLSNSEAPHRLMMVKLMANISVCLLCGAEPTLTQLMKEVQRYWKDSFETLQSVLEIENRGFPSNIQLDCNVLGFIINQPEERRCLCSIISQEDTIDDKQVALNQRLNILRNYYIKTTSNLFVTETNDVSEKDSSHCLESNFSHPCLETYTCTSEYKLYAKQNASYQIFILFNFKIPTYCLRSVGEKVLETLTRSKNLRF